MVTSTTITERSAVSSPSYTERSAISSPTYTARDTITNPFYQGRTETETDQTAPVISNFHANCVSRTYVEFDWDTDEPATCWIEVGTNAVLTGVSTVASHSHLVIRDRAIVATNLTKGTTYYVYVKSTDAYENTGYAPAIHEVYIFTTANTDDAGGAPEESP